MLQKCLTTTTLVEGVNLPADNLFITSYRNGIAQMTPVDFNNLIGRVIMAQLSRQKSKDFIMNIKPWHSLSALLDSTA